MQIQIILLLKKFMSLLNSIKTDNKEIFYYYLKTLKMTKVKMLKKSLKLFYSTN